MLGSLLGFSRVDVDDPAGKLPEVVQLSHEALVVWSRLGWHEQWAVVWVEQARGEQQLPSVKHGSREACRPVYRSVITVGGSARVDLKI